MAWNQQLTFFANSRLLLFIRSTIWSSSLSSNTRRRWIGELPFNIIKIPCGTCEESLHSKIGAAFRRFTLRRGKCSDVYSDYETNFVLGIKRSTCCRNAINLRSYIGLCQQIRSAFMGSLAFGVPSIATATHQMVVEGKLTSRSAN